MAKKDFTETEIRAMIREMLKKEIDRVERQITMKHDIKKIARDIAQEEVKKAIKDTVNKKEVKEMIRKTIVNQHKFMWEKSSFFINQI
jgi:hypothetical protein